MPILAVVFTWTPKATFRQPTRADLVSQGSSIASNRPCAVVYRGIDELSFACSTSISKLGTSGSAERFKGFDFPVVTFPRRLLLCRLHYPPAFKNQWQGAIWSAARRGKVYPLLGSSAVSASSVTPIAISSTAPLPAHTSLARLGFIYFQVAPLELGAVQRLDRRGSFASISHFDEAEAFRLPGEIVGDNNSGLYYAGLGKEVFQILLGNCVGEVAHLQPFGHFWPSLHLCQEAHGQKSAGIPALR